MWLRYIPAVEILRQVWIQQFYAPINGKVKWRTPILCLPRPSPFIPLMMLRLTTVLKEVLIGLATRLM